MISIPKWSRFALIALVCGVTLGACTCGHKPPPPPWTPPTFDDRWVLQFGDPAGKTNAVAVAKDGSVWRFREPDATGPWTVQALGGSADALPAVSFTTKFLLQVWTLASDHSLSTDMEKPSRDGWEAWTHVPAPPATDVVATTLAPGKGVAVAIRGTDSSLQVGVQPAPHAPLSPWQPVAPSAQGRPLLFPVPSLEVVYLAPDGTVTSAVANASGSSFTTAPLAAAKAQGDFQTIVLKDASTLALVGGAGGGWLSGRRATAGAWSAWMSLPPLAGAAAGAQAKLTELPDGSPGVLAVGSGGTLWGTRWAANAWSPWFDTHVASIAGGVIPTPQIGGRPGSLGAAGLGSLAQGIANWSLNSFFVFLDKVTPDPAIDGQTVGLDYSVLNGTSSPGTGSVHASWDGTPLVAGSKPFTPPLAVGATFQGNFVMGPGLVAKGGVHTIDLYYLDGTIVVIDWPGIGQVPLLLTTQFAEWKQPVKVLGFSDPLPTDNPPVTGGPYTCLSTSPDQQHACGTGACSGGNTSRTCPEDCPGSNPDVRSYNSQDLCRKTSAPEGQPHSIHDVQAAIQEAARAQTRIRVVGGKHSSNPILCTDGQTLAMDALQGAAPTLSGSGADYCSQYDCNADLKPAQPVIETFEGVQTVRVGPGVKLYELENWLDTRGLSLGFGVPQFRTPTLGGAIATGSHGSSPLHPAVISNRVQSLTLVKADGSVVELSQTLSPSQDLWKAARANLGFLGVVVQVRMRVEPSFYLRGTTSWRVASDLLGRGAPQSLVSSCDWGEMVWFPSKGASDAPVMVMCETKTDQTGFGEMRLQDPEGSESNCSFDAIELLQREACSGNDTCDVEETRWETLRYYEPPFADSDCCIGSVKVGNDAPSALRDLSCISSQCLETYLTCEISTLGLCSAFAECCTADCNPNVVGRWQQMITSAVTPVPYRPFERDWEVFIPGDRAQDAIRMAKAYFQQHDVCLPLVGVLLRFAPAEDGTLIAHTVNEGPFAGSNPGMFFEMAVFQPKGITCGNQARYEKVYSDLVSMLIQSPINGRLHWGKNRRDLFQQQRRLGTYGDNMTRFRAVVQQMDPTGMFANQLGVDMGLSWPAMTKPVPVDTDTPGCTPDPPCGGKGQPCCLQGPTCGTGLLCSEGYCAAPSQCAACGSQEGQCTAKCNGDFTCNCECLNQACNCRMQYCGTTCSPKICGSHIIP